MTESAKQTVHNVMSRLMHVLRTSAIHTSTCKVNPVDVHNEFYSTGGRVEGVENLSSWVFIVE